MPGLKITQLRRAIPGLFLGVALLGSTVACSLGQTATTTTQPGSEAATSAPAAQNTPTPVPVAPQVQLTSPAAPTNAATTPTTSTGASATTGSATIAANPTAIVPVDTSAPGRSNPAVRVYSENSASVVNITNLAVTQTSNGLAQQPQGTGSGFVIDAKGYIVTNNHVVEKSDELTVTFKDGTTIPAKLIGRDPDNDLAVVQVDPSAQGTGGKAIGSLLKPVRLGDSSKLVVGEDVIAIGSPLGLEQTVTTGIVSAVRSPQETSTDQLQLLGGAVQTDAAINPGNSGGPLFNASGEVIGVNSAGLSQSGGSIGLNFAIPVNVVKRVTPELIETGCYKHPLIGVSTLPLSLVSQAGKRQLGLTENQTGLLIQEVSNGAQEAGIKAGTKSITVAGQKVTVGGDILLAIDGQSLNTGGDLRAYVENQKQPGDTVTFTVLRGGQQSQVKVTLGTRPNDVPCR